MVMCRFRRAVLVGVALIALAAWPVRAQLVVTDPAVTLRNSISAAIQQLLVTTQRDQRTQIRRMARRLTFFTNLDKYALMDTPEWRIHEFLDASAVLFAREYHAALNYGDQRGTAYLGVTDPLLSVDDEGVMGSLSPAAWRAFSARLATVNVADAATISATNDDGVLRYNGRREQAAIEALEAQVIDPSQDQSTTAVLDKLSGAALIGVRQRQARTQFLAGIVEQLLVETKRARDTDAATINMQLTTWRDARSANEAFVTGTGDALRMWRQP
jgi:hypothetical protein